MKKRRRKKTMERKKEKAIITPEQSEALVSATVSETSRQVSLVPKQALSSKLWPDLTQPNNLQE